MTINYPEEHEEKQSLARSNLIMAMMVGVTVDWQPVLVPLRSSAILGQAAANRFMLVIGGNQVMNCSRDTGHVYF